MTDEELFPHQGFPIRLEYDDHKDHKICWFQCENHLEKHLSRYKLKLSEVKIQRYGEQTKTNFVDTTPRKRAKSNKGKQVRRVSKPKVNKSKDRVEEATQQPRKRGRPRKVKDT